MDLSYRAQIMSKDVAVATVAGNAVTPVREDLLPLFFKRSSSFEDWLRTRAIDIHRTNSRLLKKALRLAERDETELVLSVYAATITDTYWVKPEGSSLAYSDVKFTENYFDDVALTGGGVSEIALLYRNSEDKASMAHTPELTNTGSFEKCWRLIGGEWWMYKRADRLALFSELFVYELGTALGFPMAYYERVDGSTIRSRDFTGGAGVNFEPAASIVGDDDDYGVSYAAFRKLGTEFSDAYLEIIFLDAVCENVDRHANNYGVLRDVVSGKILSLAPNYDNNLALVSRGYPNRADRAGLLQVLLTEFEQETGAFADYASRHRLPVITPELLQACIEKTGVPVQTKFVTDFVMYQYSMWQLMRRKKIPPLRKVRYCCEHLKERPVPQQGRAILSLGVRKYESVGRRKKRDELEIVSDKKRGDSIIMPFDNSEKRRIFETCYQDNQRRINPLAYWTDSDIWSYSKDVGLEQCGLYNEGFERLGCIGCPMARRVGREQEFRRWPKFKAQYLRTFGHMLEDRRTLGLPVLDFASTPEQWFEWWLNDKAADKADGNQLTLWGYAEDRTAQPARLLDDIAWELGVNISDLRLVPETKRQALDIMRHMRERERYPLHMWEEAVCYLTGEKVQFGDYGKIEAYFIGNTNYAADQF